MMQRWIRRRFGWGKMMGSTLIYTLPETNELHLKMDGWKISFLLGRPNFRCYVSFEGGYPLWIPLRRVEWPYAFAFFKSIYHCRTGHGTNRSEERKCSSLLVTIASFPMRISDWWLDTLLSTGWPNQDHYPTLKSCYVLRFLKNNIPKELSPNIYQT